MSVRPFPDLSFPFVRSFVRSLVQTRVLPVRSNARRERRGVRARRRVPSIIIIIIIIIKSSHPSSFSKRYPKIGHVEQHRDYTGVRVSTEGSEGSDRTRGRARELGTRDAARDDAWLFTSSYPPWMRVKTRRRLFEARRARRASLRRRRRRRLGIRRRGRRARQPRR